MSLRLPLDNREANPEAASTCSEIAQIELWRAQSQRDAGLISDRHMAKVEDAARPRLPRARVLWNPFTGEFRTRLIADFYKSGDYLRIDEAGMLTRIMGS